MKIGLVRHFKVITPPGKRKLNSIEFDARMNGYDVYPVRANDLKINEEEWDVCYASTLSRAQTTAKTIYAGKIMSTPLIIEVPLSSFIKTSYNLHYMIWQILGRIAWFFLLKNQSENKTETLARIYKFIRLLENSGYENILIVSHGFFMKILARELKKRGFRGELEFSPQNGKLYIFKDDT